MNLPSFSIVTPSLNQGPYLERAIRSVLDQDYPNLEYVVLDGGSTDDSANIIGRHADRLTYWRSAPDAGQAAAINEGWARTGGDVVAWLNSDDFYLPGTFAFVGEFFRSNPEVDFLYGKCRVVDPAGIQRALIGEKLDRTRMILGDQPMPQPSTFLRRRLSEAVGPLDEALRYSMDYDLYLRACARTDPVFVDRSLAAFTVHPSAKTTAGRSRSRQEAFRVALRYASGWDRIQIRLRSVRALVFHALPARLRRSIDVRRRTPLGL